MNFKKKTWREKVKVLKSQSLQNIGNNKIIEFHRNLKKNDLQGIKL